MTDLERFLAKVKKTDTCWIWTAGATSAGYGVFWITGRQPMYAHRWSYEHFIAPIPDGLTVDHVRARGCTSTRCVNPAHLEAVTLEENLRRTRLTHCHRGHERSEENTYVTKAGVRQCRECKRLREAGYRASRRQAVA